MITQILENKEISRGNFWLKLHVPGDALQGYEPGTVLGLAMQHGSGTLRHPYTVSCANPAEHTLEFLYRVIPDGRMTPHLAALAPGAEMQIAGRGGHPISLEVDTKPEGIVLVSTGTGIGPIYGFCKMALDRGLKIPVKLFAGFREEADICLQSELQDLAARHSNFEWHASLSKPGPAWKGLHGRVTESMPDLLGPVKNLHFHLVGNGDMVVELYKALMIVGLEDARVTSEIYFNWPEDLDAKKLELLASKFTL